MIAAHAIFILFCFALGACVGSFLNVVVWRLPQIEHDPNDKSILGPLLKTMEGLSNPPSHCPKCKKLLRWRDNIPVIGWLKLRGKCRFCGQPISVRYPIVEAITGLLFVLYYVMFFIFQIGPCAAQPIMVPHETMGSLQLVPRALVFQHDWPMYLLYMGLIAGLLAASLIDAELFIIPIEIPWVLAGVGLVVHTIIDKPSLAGALSANPETAALAVGGGVGLILSITLWRYGIIPHSFPEGEPMLDVDPIHASGGVIDYESPPPRMTRRELIREMRKEMAFLLPPMLLAMAAWFVCRGRWWDAIVAQTWFSGLCGVVLGALVGAFTVWITRILGTLAFGRLAMGLGDVHLMFGVGAIIGAALSVVAFFLAPFFGILIAIYMLLTGKRREIPYGPYLSLATAFVLLFGCPVLAWLTPGARGLSLMLQELIHQRFARMGNLWLKIKIWTKIGAAALIAMYLLIFVIKNGGETAKFWYWYDRTYQGSLLSLVFFAFLIGGLVAMLATTTFRTIKQIRELRARSRAAKLQAEVTDMKAKAAMLQTRPQPAVPFANEMPEPRAEEEEPGPTA